MKNVIENLPDELLLEIFNYIPGKTLKNLCLVCKRWKDIITTSASTMKTLPFDLTRYVINPGNVTNEHYTVMIDHLDERWNLDVLNVLGETCQFLHVSYSIFRNPMILQNIFNNFRFLQKLVLVRVKVNFNITQENNFNITLKELELIQTDHVVLDSLTNIQTHTMSVIDGANVTNSHSLVNFMSQQEILEDLTIENLSDGLSALFEVDSSDRFKFKLKRLSTLISMIRNHQNAEDNFILFLKHQQESLNELKVEGSLTYLVYKFIIGNLNNLTDLEVNVNEIPHEVCFYELLKPNRRLKILRITSTITRTNLDGFKGLLIHYPHIQEISLCDTDSFVINDVFQLMSLKLRNLHKLSILNLTNMFNPHVTLHSLKHFSLRILNNVNQWKAFIERNDSLVSLNMGWIKRDQFTETTIKEIVSLPNLRHLKFGGRFIAAKRIFDVIKQDYMNLRILEFTVANYDEIKSLKIVFPLKKELWIPRCVYFDEGSDREPLND